MDLSFRSSSAAEVFIELKDMVFHRMVRVGSDLKDHILEDSNTLTQEDYAC